MKTLRQLMLLTLAFLPAGCASSPPTETPAIGIPTPGGWTAPGGVDDGAPSNDPGWWKTFDDGGLDTAIEECLRNNHDLVGGRTARDFILSCHSVRDRRAG